MPFSPRWLLIIALLLVGAGSLSAASREDRAYAAALEDMQDRMWNRAEHDFDQFVKRYPKSTNAPMAILLEAQAQFQQGKYDAADGLLADTNHIAMAQTTGIADQFVRWRGESQYASGRFADAAETFKRAVRDYPQSSASLTNIVSAAAAYEQLSQWDQIDALLSDTNGVFQKKLRLDPDSQQGAAGRLLLARAKAAQTDYPTALAILNGLNPHLLTPNQEWNRSQQIYNIMMEQGNDDGALAATTNLLSSKDPARLADGVAAHALLLEKKGRLGEAQAAWATNLMAGAPLERQHEALLHIAGLAAAQKDFTSSAGALENYLAQNPVSPLAPLCRLTLGEMYLQDAVTYSDSGTVSNRLAQAQDKLNQLLTNSPDNSLAGKAYLDRGWCEWLSTNYPASEADFREATQRMLPPADQAVATFKLGDSQFALAEDAQSRADDAKFRGDVTASQTNLDYAHNYFGAARESYRQVQALLAVESDLVKPLEERTLYQILRTSIELADESSAQSALQTLLEKYSGGQDAAPALLLAGEAFSDFHSQASARETLGRFEQQFTNSVLRPDVEFAVARTFELETNLPIAIAGYDTWLKEYPTNPLVSQVLFSLGRADYSAGHEDAAFTVFTNFVARFPLDGLAPQAQYWIGDYYFRIGEFTGAETNYEAIFQTKAWQDSPLLYAARYMAGRAAMGRQGFQDAGHYFSLLLGQTNCPADIAVQARFAYGSDLMLYDSGDTNNPQSNLQLAAIIFGQIIQMYPTNLYGVRAWGQMADCARQLGDFDGATNAYVQVMNSPVADATLRSRAQVGLGLTFEKKAKLAAADDQHDLLQLALDNYLDVFRRQNLRDGETASDFYVQTAGMKAGALEETLGNWDEAIKIYARLKAQMPQIGDLLDKKIATAGSHRQEKKL